MYMHLASPAFGEEGNWRSSIRARCVEFLRGVVDEICRDLGAARAELPDVVTDEREFDEARAAADQVRNMAAQGWPRDGIELAGQYQDRHARACGNKW
jgi:hypothetical protein